LEQVVANLDLVAILQLALRDAHVVHERAVGGAGIFQEVRAVAPRDARMNAADRVAIQLQARAGRASNHKYITVQQRTLTQPAAAQHDEHGLAGGLRFAQHAFAVCRDRDLPRAVPPIVARHPPKTSWLPIAARLRRPSLSCRPPGLARPSTYLNPLTHTFIHTRLPRDQVPRRSDKRRAWSRG